MRERDDRAGGDCGGNDDADTKIESMDAALLGGSDGSTGRPRAGNAGRPGDRSDCGADRLLRLILLIGILRGGRLLRLA